MEEYTLQVVILQIWTFAGQPFPVSCSFSHSFSCILLLHSSIGAVHISTPRKGCLSVSATRWDSRRAKSSLQQQGIRVGLGLRRHSLAVSTGAGEMNHGTFSGTKFSFCGCTSTCWFSTKQSGYILIGCSEWCLAIWSLTMLACCKGNSSWPSQKSGRKCCQRVARWSNVCQSAGPVEFFGVNSASGAQLELGNLVTKHHSPHLLGRQCCSCHAADGKKGQQDPAPLFPQTLIMLSVRHG